MPIRKLIQLHRIVVLMLIISLHVKSQNIAPGGVKGVSHWYVTDKNIAKPSFRSVLQGSSNLLIPQLNSSLEIGWLNNYPSLLFSGNSILPVVLGSGDFNKASYFTVYKPVNLSIENIIWYFGNQMKTNLVLTTSRMADLVDTNYMNFIDKFPLNPKVNTYVQQKPKDSITPASQILTIGYKPNFPELPITSFKGLIPEIIIYDSALNWEDQIRVASYLALKYGITLTEPNATYLNSSGEKIWDGELYSDFHNNIAGIGRDDSSGLFQKKSESSNYPGLLSISTIDSLMNKSFLLWGDNDLPLIAAEQKPGVPPMLQREWLTVASGITDTVITDLYVDTKQIDISLPPSPVYWLAIDRTGKADFSSKSTEFIKMSQLDSKGIAHFSSVVLNKIGSDKAAFGISVAQEILLSSFINYPTCSDPLSGKIEIKAWGCKFPCQLKIFKDDVLFSEQQIADNNSILITGIGAGRYQFQVVDALQHSYNDAFYINNIDAPHPVTLEKKYFLEDGRSLQLDASPQMPEGIFYQWLGPNNFQSSNAKVTITMPGTYTLRCEKSGCPYFQDIIISSPPKGAFNVLLTYPNPSKGIFTVKISLDKVAPVTMIIYTDDGKMVANKQLKGFANYNFNQELNSSGIYFLAFRSGLSLVTKKVVIVR